LAVELVLDRLHVVPVGGDRRSAVVVAHDDHGGAGMRSAQLANAALTGGTTLQVNVKWANTPGVRHVVTTWQVGSRPARGATYASRLAYKGKRRARSKICKCASAKFLQ
jgi:hypothetical protein